MTIKPGVVAYPWTPSSWDVEAGGSVSQNQLQLHNKFETTPISNNHTRNHLSPFSGCHPCDWEKVGPAVRFETQPLESSLFSTLNLQTSGLQSVTKPFIQQYRVECLATLGHRALLGWSRCLMFIPG